MSFNTMPPMKAATPNFARPSYLMIKAMLYSIAYIQALARDRQEASDMAQMCEIVRSMNLPPADLADLIFGVQHHVQHEIDLWPQGWGDEADGSYSGQEIAAQLNLAAALDKLERAFKRGGALNDAPPSDVVKFIGGADDQEGEAA